MSDSARPTDGPPSRTRFLPFRSDKRRLALGAALFGAFALGGGVTALALQGRHPALVMLTPAPISAMQDWSAVAVKGQVAEIFGDKFIVEDESGRALVETGRKGEGEPLVGKSETVTVQGRFDHGLIHAQAISHTDGRNDLIGPIGPPPAGPPPGGPPARHGLDARPPIPDPH